MLDQLNAFLHKFDSPLSVIGNITFDVVRLQKLLKCEHVKIVVVHDECRLEGAFVVIDFLFRSKVYFTVSLLDVQLFIIL